MRLRRCERPAGHVIPRVRQSAHPQIKFLYFVACYPEIRSAPRDSHPCERAVDRLQNSSLVNSSLLQKHFLDVFDVPLHRQLRCFRVMPVQRRQDFPVGRQGLLRAALNLQAALP